MINPKFLPPNQHYVPGILGGLGPLAHTKLEQALISVCHSRGISRDQDYPLWLLVSGTATPDRTTSLKTDNAALPYLKFYAQHLENSGADFIIMACNTAHAYLPELKKSVSVPFLSLIETTLNSINTGYPKVKRVGLMATTGTIISHVYQNHYSEYGLKIIAPATNSPVQKQIMDSIFNPQYGIKSTGSAVSQTAKDKLNLALEWYKERNCEAVILGCTEISTAINHSNYKHLPLIDPLNEVAKLAIEICFEPKSFNSTKHLPQKLPAQIELHDLK